MYYVEQSGHVSQDDTDIVGMILQFLSRWYSEHSAVILLRCWGDRLYRLKTQLQLAGVDILTYNLRWRIFSI